MVLKMLVSVLIAISFLLAQPGCLQSTSTGETGSMEEQIRRTNVELNDAKAELKRIKEELNSARAQLARANSDMADVQIKYLEILLKNRRSIREYTSTPLSKNEVLKLLWAAQGITSDWGGRTAPSAGALYPLKVYVVAGNVTDMPPGVYEYIPEKDSIALVKEGDVRTELSAAALWQRSVRDAAIDIIIAADYEITARKYGNRAERYVQLEAGHAAQNVCLAATALQLGLVPIGAFDDERVAMILGLARNEKPLYILPVGKKKQLE